jgi:hypothetical protein
MPEAKEKKRLFANTLASAAAQFGALAIAFLLAPLLIRTFAMAALLYWMAFLVLMVSRAEREGLIATGRALMHGLVPAAW